MNLLAFDTGTEMMSVAVSRSVDGQVQQWQHITDGGAKASTDLIPAILGLMQHAGLGLNALDAICFGCGPGSFTGLRTACSVAQGLAFGASVPVLAIDSLLAVAEEARYAAFAEQPAGIVTALLDARMDEMYGATYGYAHGRWIELAASTLMKPEHLIRDVACGLTQPWVMAGNVFGVYGARVAQDDPGAATALRIIALPTAVAMLRLAPHLLAAGKAVSAEHALPSYIRDKVAKTTAERMAEKAAAQTTATVIQ